MVPPPPQHCTHHCTLYTWSLYRQCEQLRPLNTRTQSSWKVNVHGGRVRYTIDGDDEHDDDDETLPAATVVTDDTRQLNQLSRVTI